jgi:hypothetical protein
MDMKRSCHNHCKRFSDGKIEQMITGVNGNKVVCILRRAIRLMVLHIIEILFFKNPIHEIKCYLFILNTFIFRYILIIFQRIVFFV